jgi:hypothetical protein
MTTPSIIVAASLPTVVCERTLTRLEPTRLKLASVVSFDFAV